MRRQRWWLPLVALLFVTNWKLTSTLPVPDEELDTSTKLLGSSVVTSVSVVTGSSDNVANDNSMRKSTADRKRVIPSKDLPGSPGDLLRPDRFQFHTYNKDGNVVTTQMTEQQIHSLIATGGGHLPMEIHEPQKAGEVPSGGMKVSDVVQNVQNVLKGELNKPATMMTSVPTIPAHVNTEWSSILPTILGGDTESAPVSEPISTMTVDINETPIITDKKPIKSPETTEIPTNTTNLPVKEPAMVHESDKKPIEILITENHNEKPMIQIPVITVDKKLPSHQTEEDSMPVFQMLNTISADKINAKNKTNVDDESKPIESQHVNLGETEIATKPERLPVKQQLIKESIMEDSTIPVNNHTEMVEINLNFGNIKPSEMEGNEKPLVKPETGIITAETISKSPESEIPSKITVISETHSTSMKVSGHEEIPLREPSKPLKEIADPVRVSSESKKPETVMEIMSTDGELDATIVKTEVPMIMEQPIESTTKAGFFTQGVSFFGNLPQTVTSIVSDFISNNKSNSTPIVEESDTKIPLKTSQSVDESIGTIDLVKIPDSTKSPMHQTTIASIHETVTSMKPSVNEKPVFQMMPEMIPAKKTPNHGTLPSAVSSIEHIIETLNDPTGSLSGTVAADHFMIQNIPESKFNVTKVEIIETDTTKPSKIGENQTSTSATPISVEIPAEISSAKPIEPLPTELADSLSSMISQISDVMPSVLPISEKAGLDTTEKKTSSSVNAEEQTTEDVKISAAQVISKTPEAPVNRIKLPVKVVTEKPQVASTKEPANEDSTMTRPVGVKETTEKLKDISSTEVPTIAPVTTQSSKLDNPTTVKIDVPLVTKESSEISVAKLEQPVSEKVKASGPESEKSKLEMDELEASSDITTDQLIVQALVKESVKMETVTEVPTTDASMEKNSTVKPTTIVMSSASSIVSADQTERPIKLQTDDPVIVRESASSTVPTVSADKTERPIKIKTDDLLIVQEPPKSENQKTEMALKQETKENITEPTIVRIDITEAKPTQFTHMNKSQVTNTNADNDAESPLVRIKLTNPVTMINNMIASANVDVSPSPIVPLSLPETGSVPPNIIASGLIAGYPSSTTQSTDIANFTKANPISTIEPVTSLPEVQILNDSPVSNVTGNLKPSDGEVENTKIKITGTVEFNKGNNSSETIKNSETSTLKDVSTVPTEIPLNRIHLSKIPDILENLEKSTTTQASLTAQTSTEKSRLEETSAESTTSKSVEFELVTTSVASSQKTPENFNTSTTLVENVTAFAEGTTTESSLLPNGQVPANRIDIPASTIVQQTEASGKLNETSKIIETTVSTSPESQITTGQPGLMEVKIKNPVVGPESTNSTKSEVPDVRIDVGQSKLSEIPSKIQLTDLPIIETTIAPKKPVINEVIQAFHTTEKPQSIATMQIPVESTDDNEASSNVSLQATTLSTLEKTSSESGKEESKLKDVPKKPVKINEESTMPEKITETPISTAQHTEEIRIQVNDTAVLVTKRPISDVPNQKPGDLQKIPENQAMDEPTTPKIASITEDSYTKLGEKIQLPVPIKVSELSPSDMDVDFDSSIKKDTINGMGTETRIRLGEEQQGDKTTGEKLSENVEDPRKPIKKNTDNDSSLIEEKYILASSTNKEPIPINDEPSANREKDSNSQSSTKVKITKPVSSNVPSNLSKIEEPVKIKTEPTKVPEKDKPMVVITEIHPISKPSKYDFKPTMNIKKDDGIVKPAEDQWTLIPQQVYPSLMEIGPSHVKQSNPIEEATILPEKNQSISSPSEKPSVSLDHSQSANGLDTTVRNLETDLSYFVNLCNELAFAFWTATNMGLSTERSLVVSPFGMTSLLAMIFLGARGLTSEQMNELLKLDEVSSFNPHLVFQNVTDSVGLARNQDITTAAFIRELFIDRSKARKIMPFYKNQAQQFYDGIIAEVNFATISDIIRRRTNLMIKKQTGGRVKNFIRPSVMQVRSPLAVVSANIFQTDCSSNFASSEGRDGELHFVVSPAVRQRKLVPVPATVWRAGVLAGYEPSVDATAIALGGVDKLVSIIFVTPGQQGLTAPGDTLDRLEERITKGSIQDGPWNKLLKVLIPRPGLELQVPKFRHRSAINATRALKRMGLEQIFTRHADLKGINGVGTDLYIAELLQINLFGTCGNEDIKKSKHHDEVYPSNPIKSARKINEFEEQTDNAFTDYLSNEEEQDYEDSAVPYVSHTESRSVRQNDGKQTQRLKLDRPFLYFVRHNPTGLILYMGRFNPRLLP